MKIEMDNNINIFFDNEEDYDISVGIAKERLVHDNPDIRGYANSQKYPKGFNNKVYSYNYSDYKRSLSIPRGSGDVLREILKKLELKISKDCIKDKTTKGHEIKFKHKFKPRDELQINAIESFLSNNKKHLILQGSCGFGKTFCALKILESISVSTLILVDENLLLDQWIDTITNDCKFDLDKLGVVGKGKEDYIDKDIIVASKDTLINRPEIIDYINQNIGFVIVDEAHVASADIFQKVLKKLTANRILGLTATPKRSDGLSYLMHEQIGPICFKADRKELIKLGSVMNPELRTIYVNRGKYFDEQFEEFKKKKLKELNAISPDKNEKYKIGNRLYTKATWEKRKKEVLNMKTMDWNFLSNVVENDIYSIKEISKLIKYHYDRGDQSICICKKIEFARKYLNALKELGVKENEISLILGETKSADRKELIKRAKDKELKIIITSSILDKGISIDSANTLFLLYPSKNENSTEQRIGRVSRTQKGKEYAYVYDFIYDHGMFFSQFFKSQKIEYRECRFNVEKECTTYDCLKMKDFITGMIDHFYFQKDFTPIEIDINNLDETLKEGNTLIVKSI